MNDQQPPGGYPPPPPHGQPPGPPLGYGPPPPGHGGPPGYGPTPHGSSSNSTGKLALIGGAVLLVVVIIGLVLLLAIRGGESDSALATSESIVAAVDDQDCEAIKRLVTKEFERQLGRDCGGYVAESGGVPGWSMMSGWHGRRTSRPSDPADHLVPTA